jgi:hypothetical protein
MEGRWKRKKTQKMIGRGRRRQEEDKVVWTEIGKRQEEEEV